MIHKTFSSVRLIKCCHFFVISMLWLEQVHGDSCLILYFMSVFHYYFINKLLLRLFHIKKTLALHTSNLFMTSHLIYHIFFFYLTQTLSGKLCLGFSNRFKTMPKITYFNDTNVLSGIKNRRVTCHVSKNQVLRLEADHTLMTTKNM